MKGRIFAVLLALALICICTGCTKELTIVNTYEITPSDKTEEYIESSEDIISVRHYEMSDGSWRTDAYPYKYRLVLSGRLSNAKQDITYIVLSNRKDITFEQAWKASGLSSNMDDYFPVDKAIIVGCSFYDAKAASAH